MDCRYPWERDPVHEPPHYRDRFDDRREKVSEAKELLRDGKLEDLKQLLDTWFEAKWVNK